MTTEGFGNDGDMDIENLDYKIGFQTWGIDPAIAAQLPVMALVVYVLHPKLRITGMLVFNALFSM